MIIGIYYYSVVIAVIYHIGRGSVNTALLNKLRATATTTYMKFFRKTNVHTYVYALLYHTL